MVKKKNTGMSNNVKVLLFAIVAIVLLFLAFGRTTSDTEVLDDDGSVIENVDNGSELQGRLRKRRTRRKAKTPASTNLNAGTQLLEIKNQTYSTSVSCGAGAGSWQKVATFELEVAQAPLTMSNINFIMRKGTSGAAYARLADDYKVSLSNTNSPSGAFASTTFQPGTGSTQAYVSAAFPSNPVLNAGVTYLIVEAKNLELNGYNDHGRVSILSQASTSFGTFSSGTSYAKPAISGSSNVVSSSYALREEVVCQ